MRINVNEEYLHLQLSSDFVKKYPLRYKMLVQESHYQRQVQWLLELELAKP